MTSNRIILHESTQRGLCRLAFVLLGLVPILSCIFLATAALIPGYHSRQAQSWEKQLEATFGLTFRIGEAHALAPFRFRLDNVQVLHPESQKLIGTARSIRLELAGYDAWNIQLEAPEVQADQVASGCRTLHHWYLSRGHANHQRTTFHSDELTIVDGDNLLELSDLSIKVLPTSLRWGLTAGFKIPPAHAKQPINPKTLPECQLLVLRDVAEDVAATGLKLQIPSQIPCETLAKLLDLKPPTTIQLPESVASPPTLFSGILDVRFRESKVDYYLTNATISQVDMGRLSAGTETLLSGVGQWKIAQAKLSSSQLEWAQGSLEVGPGRMDSGFLRSLAFSLGISPRQQPVGLVGFDRLSLNFSLEPQFIRLFGTGPQGVVLEDAHGVLAWKTDTSRLPVIALVHALAFKPENPTIPSRISPLVRTALLWLPLEENQRQQLVSRQSTLR